MAVLLTDLIEDIEARRNEADEEGFLIVSIEVTPAGAQMILAALKRFENCDGKHD